MARTKRSAKKDSSGSGSDLIAHGENNLPQSAPPENKVVHSSGDEPVPVPLVENSERKMYLKRAAEIEDSKISDRENSIKRNRHIPTVDDIVGDPLTQLAMNHWPSKTEVKLYCLLTLVFFFFNFFFFCVPFKIYIGF
jgi:hypothetical protein